MKSNFKIGDLVMEFDAEFPNKKFALGIVVPFPREFIESSVAPSPETYEEEGIVWVHWPLLGSSNWCYVDEMRLLSENR